ncbi:MAG TPA: hypothetical protein VFR50_02855 [Casimicrobiaceae bacterium]|nr:hypothetical protein [Casimicrobiaceae bacterium]
MANTTGKCAHGACNCSVPAGQSYCSDYCRQHAQGAQGRQQSQQGTASGQQGASSMAGSCACGHPACQHTG